MNRVLLEDKIKEKYPSTLAFIKDLGMSQATFYRRLEKWDWTLNEVRRTGIVLNLSKEELLEIF